MAVLNPFTPDRWIAARLLASSAVTAIVSDRIQPARPGDLPEAWPFILYSPYPDRGDFEESAEEITLAINDWWIRVVMREDKVSGGVDIEDFNEPAYLAIAECFNGVSDTVVATGIVHGCHIKRPDIRLYGEAGRRVSEMGVIVHITST